MGFSLHYLILIGLITHTPLPCRGQQEAFPNIDYLGRGYDIVKGNPQTNEADPGFRLAVIRLQNNNETNECAGSTNDVANTCSVSSRAIDHEKWRIPNFVEALPQLSCSIGTQVNSIRGTTSYQNSLAVDVEFRGEVDSVLAQTKFSASAGYKSISDGTSSHLKTYVTTVARCVIYKVMLESAGFHVTDDFTAAVRSLPLEKNKDAYTNFISIYGTHYASELEMGAKAIIQSEFEQVTWIKLKNANINVQLAAEASYKILSGEFSSVTAEEKSLAHTFDSSRSSMIEIYIGNKPLAHDGNWTAWAQTVQETPFPVRYVLRPIHELFDAKYFPADTKASDLVTKSQNLKAVYEAYALQFANGSYPKPDNPELEPVKMTAQSSDIRGVGQVSCRPSGMLLSCGIDNIQVHDFDRWRYAKPLLDSNQYVCECRDDYGAKCMAWCTNAVEGFSIEPRQGNQNFDVPCGEGKKVLGCHIQGDVHEAWQHHYPKLDGTGCHCYDYHSATCFATCATNIVNHEVRSEHGDHVVTVKCSSPDNFVLGCGAAPDISKGPERWRAVHVVGSDSCQCYDAFGITCYAICGQFN